MRMQLLKKSYFCSSSRVLVFSRDICFDSQLDSASARVAPLLPNARSGSGWRGGREGRCGSSTSWTEHHDTSTQAEAQVELNIMNTMTQEHKQIWNQFWWLHLVVKVWTNTSGTTYNWPNLEPMQVEFYLAGEITQVIDSIPWVRCASSNVCIN